MMAASNARGPPLLARRALGHADLVRLDIARQNESLAPDGLVSCGTGRISARRA
jgi:hypothetical protein